jgi:hypothetical protein
MAWTTQQVESAAEWNTSQFAPSSTISSQGKVATTATWVKTRVETDSTWTTTDLAIDLDGWAILEAEPIYFTEIRKWDELRVAWGV